MKRTFVAFGLLLIVTSLCWAQEATPTSSPASSPKPQMNRAQVQRRIIAMEKTLWEAWKNKDLKPFKATLWSGSVMVGAGGVAAKEDTLNALAGADCEVRSYSLSDIKVSWLTNDVVLLTYKGMQDATCDGNAEPSEVWASSVYVRKAGKWYSATHQETPAQ